MSLRFTTTRLSGLRAAGRTGELQHAVIAPYLRRELGIRHARFFADFEPEGSDRRAWYAEAEAPPRRATELTLERQAALRAAADAVVGDIRALADRLLAGSGQQANLGRILAAATRFPEEDLWCDGDQPIVVNWGFAREEQLEVLPRAITVLAPPPSRQRSAGALTAAVMPWTGRLGSGVRLQPAMAVAPLLWLVFILLVWTIDRQLLPACGIDGRWPSLASWTVMDACPRRVPADTAAAEGLRLQALVRQAELQLAQRRQVCTAPGRRASHGTGPATDLHRVRDAAASASRTF